MKPSTRSRIHPAGLLLREAAATLYLSAVLFSAVVLDVASATTSVCSNSESNSPCYVESGGPEYQHDGHTRTQIPREVWKNFADAPKHYYRFPQATASQGMRLSDDGQYVFIPHIETPDSLLHAHFARHGNAGYDNAIEYGYSHGVFTKGSSSPLLDTNVAQISYQETILVKEAATTSRTIESSIYYFITIDTQEYVK